MVEDILWVNEKVTSGEEWECLVLDFEDAFKQMPAHGKERWHLGGRAWVEPFVLGQCCSE